MQRRTAGVVFIGFAVALYGIRYLSAAIYGSNAQSWGGYLFRDLLNAVGRGPLVLSILSLAVGVVYLLYAEFGDSMKGATGRIRDNWREFDTETGTVGGKSADESGDADGPNR